MKFEKKEKKDMGGLFIPAGIFIGMGAGFAAFAITILYKHKNK